MEVAHPARPDGGGPDAAVLAVQVTAPSRETADRLGRSAVQRRLAACAQVSGPVRSTYRWRGEVESADEWVCTLKTTALRMPELAQLLRDDHPYEVPEIVAVGVVSGDGDYLDWVAAQCAPGAEPDVLAQDASAVGWDAPPP